MNNLGLSFVATKETATCLQVENDVLQFDEHMLSSMFDRTSTQDTSRNEGHMGIGLTIVKILVEKQGGRIGADLKGKKLNITIEFPVRLR